MSEQSIKILHFYLNTSFILTKIIFNNVSTTNVIKTHIHMNFIFN